MKKLLIKVALFLFIPLVVLMLTEAFLPPTLFTYRTYEALMFSSAVPKMAALYPNQQTSINAVGDLCHHTDKSIQKKERWVTDQLGFRNDSFIQEPDILIIGDSYVVGTSLTQEETITNKIKSNSNKKLTVYNIAPSSFSDFDQYLKMGILKKPKWIVFARVERIIPEPLVLYNTNSTQNTLKKIFAAYSTNVLIDKAIKLASVKWLRARLNNTKGLGKPSGTDPTMFFFEGDAQKHSSEDLELTAKTILSYKKYCDSLGIKLLVVPMPDKESVYFEKVPFVKQPNYLFKLDSLLKNENISTIHTLRMYNEYNKLHNTLLYHLDDTHWNATATDLVSKEILKIVTSPVQ